MTNIITIVGAGSGIGNAVAKRFGKSGFDVALIARRAEALSDYVAELTALGITAKGFPADAGDETSLKGAFHHIVEQLGETGTLVYNAAHGRQQTGAVDTDYASLIEDFKINVGGAVLSVQAVLPGMKARKRGTILFTGGGLALNPYYAFASLAIGKAGIRSLAYSLGKELEIQGIHVATVTIAGSVQPGTHFDPDLIAEEYWKLHSQPADAWEREIVYK